MARFYGWTDNEIRSLDTVTFSDYFLAISALDADEIKRAMVVADWPNIAKNERTKRWNQLDKISKPLSKSANGPKLTNKELAEILKNR